jgi:uncharacterized membrane protein YhaH (DUF805 family)
MNFPESIKTCFTKYADFTGRATRSEYWWFVLFYVIVGCVTSAIHVYLASIFYLAIIVPLLAVATRRLHDTNRSGWWQLIAFLPLIGAIVLIVFLAQEGKPEESAAVAA